MPAKLTGRVRLATERTVATSTHMSIICQRSKSLSCVLLLMYGSTLSSAFGHGGAFRLPPPSPGRGEYASAAGSVVSVYVRAGNGLKEYDGCTPDEHGDCGEGSWTRPDDCATEERGKAYTLQDGDGLLACGETEKLACPDIRTGLQAFPKYLPKGTTPELRLLPGLYTGNNNVFFGDPSDTVFPDAARGIRLVGWQTITEGATDDLSFGAKHDTYGNETATVISCQGRQSRNNTSPAMRGVWLREGRISQLANLTITDCPGGGVGVDLSTERGDVVNSSVASASLSSIKLLGNGGVDCQIGGGLYLAVTSSDKDLAEKSSEENGVDVPSLTISDCIISNNTAELGGGIGVVSVASPLSSGARTAAVDLFPGVQGSFSPSKGVAGLPPPHVESPALEMTLNEGTLVSDNTAASGGGVWALGAAVSASEGVSVKGNVARGMKARCGEEESCAGRGGGMLLDSGSLYIRGASFEGNRAQAYQTRDEYAKGGGVSIKASAVDASACMFVGNSATAEVKSAAGLGGAAYFDEANATLNNCRFEDNNAGGSDLFGQLASFGGALVARGPSCAARISNSSFVGNAARRGGSGGALWVEDGASATLAYVQLLNNTAASSYTHKGAGGAVSVSASARLVVSEGSVFEGNSAGPEGVGEFDPPCLSGEGGAIHASGSGITLADVTLARNRCETGALDAGCSGGALSITGGGPSPSPTLSTPVAADKRSAEFDRCVFEGNEAGGASSYSVYSGAGQGGAAAVRFAFPIFTACNFTANSAGGGGGAAPAAGGAVLLFLSRNGGGAMAGAENSLPTFVDCNFEDNRAGSRLLQPSGNDPSRDKWRRGRKRGVEDARAGNGGHGIGGALAAIASSPALNGCAFRNNSAVAVFSDRGANAGHSAVSGGSPSFGGAIVLTSDCSGTSITNCTLDANVAIGGVGGDLAVLAAPSGGPDVLSSYLAKIGATTHTFNIDLETDEAGASVVDDGERTTAVLSGCTFRPAPPQTDPAVNPWCDGHSETTESPFLFVLDGGTVELLSPAFYAPGQAFVAQVNRRTLPGHERGSGEAHLRIVDGPASPSQLRKMDRSIPSSRRETDVYRSPETEISFVSVGATITLDGSGDRSSGVNTYQLPDDVAGNYAEKASDVPAFPLQDLVILRGKLVLHDRGAVVSGSARLRAAIAYSGSRTTATVSGMRNSISADQLSLQGAFVDGKPGERGDDADAGTPATSARDSPRMAERIHVMYRQKNGDEIVNYGKTADSSSSVATEVRDSATERDDAASRGDAAAKYAGAVTLEVTGEALISQAWEAKPFFLGTSLSQIFPSSAPASWTSEGSHPSDIGVPPRGLFQNDRRKRGVEHSECLSIFAFRNNGLARESCPDDVVCFDGVDIEVTGSSTVKGEVILFPSAAVKINPTGSLTLAGDAKFRRNSQHFKLRSAPTSSDKETITDAANKPCLLPAHGAHKDMPVLLNHGMLSVPRGLSLTVAGGLEQGRTGAILLALPSPLYLEDSDLEALYVEDERHVTNGLTHPLVLESGAVKLAGAVNASVISDGGDSERIKMHRKWAVVRFDSNHTAAAADVTELSISGPAGVSMEFSMQPIRRKGERPQRPFADCVGEADGGTGCKRKEVTPRGLGGALEKKGQEWELVMEAVHIQCQNMLAYANVSAAGGPCQACLLNVGCSWCGGPSGRGCVPAGQGPTWLEHGKKQESSCQVDNCCPGGCNSVGECDFFSATCSCPWLYAGSSCGELSTRGAVTLSLSLSALALVVLSLACGRSSRRKQMEAVMGTLHELKRGLLSEADGSIADDESSIVSGRSNFAGGRLAFNVGGRGQLPGGGGSGAVGGGASGGGAGSSYQHMWPRDYIQDLQQNLALRDVMVSFSELELSRKIGSGAAGSVWRGSWRGAAVAVKVIRRPFHQAMELTGRDLEVFKREAYLMTRLRHPNIVLIMGVTFAPAGHHITLDGQGSVSASRRRELGFEDNGANEQGSLCIVTELLSRGSLEDVIREGGLRTASYALILNLALQAARGMLYLHTHSPPIVHRDLKSSNLVVDEHWHVKVTDFGMSRFVPEPPTASVKPTIAPSSPPHASLAQSPHTPVSSPVHPLATPRGSISGVDLNRTSSSGHEESKISSQTRSPMFSLEDARKREGRGRRGGTGTGGGLAREVDVGLTTNLGTVAWAAPEMLLAGSESGRGEYTSKVDVYSFGVVLWELWERRRPFEELRSRFDIADTVAAGGRPAIGRGCPPPYAELIGRCWHQDPSRRPLFQDIVEDLEAELGSIESLTEL